MVEGEAKGEAHASESKPENEASIKNGNSETAASELIKSNVENSAVISGVHASGSEPENKADGDTAASERVKSNVEMPVAISGAHAGSEPKSKAPVKNANTETAASELVTENTEVPAAISGGGEKIGKHEEKDNKNEENNKEKTDHTLSATVENSRKRKKPTKKPIKQKKAPIKNSGAETVASEVVKLNGEVSAAIPGAEEKKEEEKKDESKEGNNKEKVDCTPSTKGKNLKKRKRKKVTKSENKASVKNADAEAAASELVKSNVVTAAISGGEEKKEKNTKEQKEKEKVDTLSAMGENSRKRKRKNAKGIDKPETSTKEKDAKKSESMGMIFMCSSKTKQDCYHYKVLGLPATKKDLVAKIYKGMRLFLFDIDLKLLYGIYKAEGPGGYNIEPKAFNSAFPSQVRFSPMEDCLPLAEEKFKAVIKDNYYAKNKFDCILKAEQVKNLCKLFKVNGKDRESKQVGRDRKTEANSHVDRAREKGQGRDRERRQGVGRERRHGADRERRQGRDRERRQGQVGERRQGRVGERREGRVGDRRHGQDRVRRPASGDRRVSEADGIYERQAFGPSVLVPRLPPPLPTYAYERPSDLGYYRRDAEHERYERQHLDLELNRREEIVYRDARVYRDPPSALEPTLSYHESLYTRGAPPPAHELPLSYHEAAYSRAPPLVHEPLSYHEPSDTRALPPAYHHLPGLYRY